MTVFTPEGVAEPRFDAIDPDLVVRFRNLLGQYCGNREVWSFSRVSVRQTPRGRFTVYRADDAGSGRTLAIKRHDDPDRNRLEFEALRSLRQHNPDCVAPLVLDEDRQFFVLEWIDAPLLLASLPGPGRAARLARAGKWLRRLHGATALRTGEGEDFPWLRFPKPSGDAVLDGAVTRLRDRARELPERPGPHAMLHGDYHPGNLFDTGDRLLAFDREAGRSGLVYKDVAFFLLSLAMHRSLAETGERPWTGDAEADRRSFFDGYGALDRRNLAVFDFSEDLILFRRWRYSRTYFGDARKTRLLEDRMRAYGLIGEVAPAAYPGRAVSRLMMRARWSTRRG